MNNGEGDTMDLTKQSPVEIDTALFPVLERLGAVGVHIVRSKTTIDEYEAKGQPFAVHSIKEHLPKLEAERDELEAEAAPFEAEYERRGGWNRYILVSCSGGHLHRSSCHTLTPGRTMTGIVPAASGLDQGEVVEKFNYTACTHCFPDAPVAPKLTPEEEGFCPKSGTYADTDRRYVRCECGGIPNVTSRGRIRKHKVGSPK
jgi:hypothetical protein